ncbi:MAG: response regulator transcription factor [Candidatus Krumholzibacteriia bacterium]
MADELILVVEDEADILELLEYTLVKSGYRVDCAETGEQGLVAAREHAPDLVVLDLMLPGLSGLEVCRRLKSEPATAALPIIILTARGEEEDVVAGFEAGADDYVTKPFSPRILRARVSAMLRRQQSAGRDVDGVLRVFDIVIHPGRHEVMVDEQEVRLTNTEFRILHFLASRPGWVFTRNQIVRAVHGEDYPVTGRSVDVQMAALRKKLGPAGRHIETVRGVGYKLGD